MLIWIKDLQQDIIHKDLISDQVWIIIKARFFISLLNLLTRITKTDETETNYGFDYLTRFK